MTTCEPRSPLGRCPGVRLIPDGPPNSPSCAYPDYLRSSESRVLVDQDQAADLTAHHLHSSKAWIPCFVMVHARIQVADHCAPPALGRSVRSRTALVQITSRVAMAHAGLAHGRRFGMGRTAQIRTPQQCRVPPRVLGTGHSSLERSHLRSVSGFVPSHRAASPILTRLLSMTMDYHG